MGIGRTACALLPLVGGAVSVGVFYGLTAGSPQQADLLLLHACAVGAGSLFASALGLLLGKPGKREAGEEDDDLALPDLSAGDPAPARPVDSSPLWQAGPDPGDASPGPEAASGVREPLAGEEPGGGGQDPGPAAEEVSGEEAPAAGGGAPGPEGEGFAGPAPAEEAEPRREAPGASREEASPPGGGEERFAQGGGTLSALWEEREAAWTVEERPGAGPAAAPSGSAAQVRSLLEGLASALRALEDLEEKERRYAALGRALKEAVSEAEAALAKVREIAEELEREAPEA